MDVMTTEEFKKAFWEWFDSISPVERKKFNEYKDDFATLYFYNKVWSKKS